MTDCNICYFYNNAEIVHIADRYRIVHDGEFYYSIWHECCSWGGVRTCKRNIHNMRFETEQKLRELFHPDKVGIEVIEGPHLHFKCWRRTK